MAAPALHLRKLSAVGTTVRMRTMKKFGLAAFLAFLAMAGPAVAQQRADWISFKPGMLGPRLVSTGTVPTAFRSVSASRLMAEAFIPA